MKTASIFGLTLAAVIGLALVACSGGTGEVGSSSGASSTSNGPEGQVVSATGLTVKATFVAASLADDCGAAKGSGDSAGFAPSEDCAEAKAPGEGGGGCGGICQQTNMQLSFAATGSGASARVSIESVELVDASGKKIDTLTSREPKQWNGSTYAPWDETVAAGADLKVSYNLSAPNWANASDSSGRMASQVYRLRITIKIDGTSTTLESGDLMREPEVVT